MERLSIVQREDEALAEGTNGHYYSGSKGFHINRLSTQLKLCLIAKKYKELG
jgi:hypothetical protein